MSNIKFDTKSFAFITDMELSPGNGGWVNVGRTELLSYATDLATSGFTSQDLPNIFEPIEAISTFLTGIKPSLLGEEEPEEVLSVLVKGGVVEYVNGPCFYADEENNIVLRVGTTPYTARLENEKIHVGNISGSIAVQAITRPDGSESKDDHGNTRYRITGKLIDLRQENPQVFEIPFRLQKEIKNSDNSIFVLTEGRLLKAIQDGFLDRYLQSVPTGNGGGFIDPRCLPEGEYLVTDISDPREDKYNKFSWNLTLEGIGVVGSRGQASDQLESSWQIYQKAARKTGITFKVASHTVEYGTADGARKAGIPYFQFIADLMAGKVSGLEPEKIGSSSVKHSMSTGLIRSRVPESNPILQQSVEKVVGFISESSVQPAIAQSAQAPVAATTQVPVEVEPEYDDIPF